jgi:hypothetical protein
VQGSLCILEDGKEKTPDQPARLDASPCRITISSIFLSPAIAACPTFLRETFWVYLANTRNTYPR